ncbi:MAG: hypothetical protein U0872_02745 [Planctomycetaceae bacterium]
MRISWHVCIVLSCVGPLFAANKPGKTPTGRNEVLAILRDESRTSGDVVNRRVALTGLRTENSAAETWWQSGFVKSAGEWISYDAVRNDDSLMEHYRRWRAAAAPGATAQFQLANRCRDAGLTDQERVHLSRGLWTGNVSSPERYLTRLGYRLVGNQWFTPDELRAGEQEFQASKSAWRKVESRWERLANWLDGTPKQRTAALAELKSLNSASNLAVFEQYLALTSESAGQAVVLVAQELDSYRASQALARLAIGSPWRSVQTQAIEALRNRPYEHYVPLVLSVLHTPISAQFRADLNADSRAATPVLNAELRMVLTSEGRGQNSTDGMVAGRPSTDRQWRCAATGAGRTGRGGRTR